MRYRFGLWAVSLAAVVGVAACGDDDANDPGGEAGEGGDGSGGSAGSSNGGRAGASGGAGADGGDPGAGGDGASAASGGDAGSAGAGGSAGDDGTPLLDRPADITYDCDVARPTALLGIDAWVNAGVFADGGEGLLPRLEGDLGGVTRVGWSTLDFDGTLGARRVIHEPDDSWLSYLSVARNADRFTLLWSESSALPGASGQLAVAQVNAAGAVLTPAAPLDLGGSGELTSPRIAPRGEGYALVWTETGEEMQTLRFAALDAEGALAGDVAPILEGSGLLEPHELVPHGDGFVLTYSNVYFPTNTQGTFYVLLDADGVRKSEPVQLSGGYGATSSLARGDRLLLAWTEEGGTFEEENIHRVIGIGALGPSGQRVGPTYTLQTPVVNQENVDPHWVDFGEDVGLFWSQGSVIYFCAGCFPDNRLQFALFDGNDFTRRSAVVELTSPNQGGLRFPRAIRQDNEVLMIANVTHHVYAEGGSATLTCTP